MYQAKFVPFAPVIIHQPKLVVELDCLNSKMNKQTNQLIKITYILEKNELMAFELVS